MYEETTNREKRALNEGMDFLPSPHKLLWIEYSLVGPFIAAIKVDGRTPNLATNFFSKEIYLAGGGLLGFKVFITQLLLVLPQQKSKFFNAVLAHFLSYHGPEIRAPDVVLIWCIQCHREDNSSC